MTHRTKIPTLFLGVTMTLLFGLAGCDKSQADSQSPNEDAQAAKDSDEPVNLCQEYTTCNDCISGEVRRGKTEGEAETACALAVTGCWTTWDKPVVCGEKSYDEEPKEKSASVNLCQDYTTCDDCISGQISRGKTEGEAETECALAVTGCWTTWDKPITCGEYSYDEQPS